MQFLEMMDVYTSATVIDSCSGSNPAAQHCPGQCHWLKRKHQFALQQVAVVKSAKKLVFACDIY